jgi:hypothetical protein
MSGLWDLPTRFENRVLNSLVGGWSLNGIASLWSGYPITVTSGVDNARTGTGNQRADLIGDPYLSDDRTRDQKIAEWLNKAAFRTGGATLGTYGNLGRNVFEDQAMRLSMQACLSASRSANASALFCASKRLMY